MNVEKDTFYKNKLRKRKSKPYLTTSSMLFLYTPSSLSAGKPIAIMFG